MTDELKNIASVTQSIVTTVSIIVGAIWVYYKFIRQKENFPHIEFSADINVVGEQKDSWIVELIAVIQNKGKVQHKIKDFDFDLNALYDDDEIQISDRWGGQIDFPHLIQQGSFMPKKYEFFFIDPGIKATYSYIAKVPRNASFLVFHSWFRYVDRKNAGHTAEKSIRLPRSTEKSPGGEKGTV